MNKVIFIKIIYFLPSADLFKLYTFHEEPYSRLELRGIRKGLIKSFSFRTVLQDGSYGTFTHPTFNNLWDLFIVDGKKSIKKGLILNHLTDIGLTYWIMDDGSLQKKFNFTYSILY